MARSKKLSENLGSVLVSKYEVILYGMIPFSRFMAVVYVAVVFAFGISIVSFEFM